jgi:formylglycine-generating enzyme required for sulfatase activity
MKERVPPFLLLSFLVFAMSGCGPRATASAVETWTRPTDGMAMVHVPAGEFEMGSDDDEVDCALELCSACGIPCTEQDFEKEQPVHPVALDSFWIDRTEVTNAQYRQCVEAGACGPHSKTGSATRESYYDDSACDDYPVIWIAGRDARAYCEWVGARLPTEAEWEYAARGPEGRIFPWGNEFDGTRLNYCDANCELGWADETVDDGYADTAPVGSFPAGASWCGALDMAGNVREWVADWYDPEYYSRSPSQNPIGPEQSVNQVMRGGSWDASPYEVRSAMRVGDHAQYKRNFVGFRCAKDAE